MSSFGLTKIFITKLSRKNPGISINHGRKIKYPIISVTCIHSSIFPWPCSSIANSASFVIPISVFIIKYININIKMTRGCEYSK